MKSTANEIVSSLKWSQILYAICKVCAVNKQLINSSVINALTMKAANKGQDHKDEVEIVCSSSSSNTTVIVG